jgi:hypothetical protein
MNVAELIDYLSALLADYKVVVGIHTDYHDIDYVETDYTSSLVSLWTNEIT